MKQLQLDLDDELLTLIDEAFEKIILDDLAVPVEKRKAHKGGMSCRKCKDFNEYAEPNQKDGSHMCYRCRNNI
ncbi:MAG TPA: hypothetical protein VM577_20790 [Anaerovoracaceae bacterium]|nr:hypothetical protein [Anaerovoracaceae bacterium]